MMAEHTNPKRKRERLLTNSTAREAGVGCHAFGVLTESMSSIEGRHAFERSARKHGTRLNQSGGLAWFLAQASGWCSRFSHGPLETDSPRSRNATRSAF